MKSYRTSSLKLAFIAACIFILIPAQALAQAHVSTQSHDGTVTCMASSETATNTDLSFFSADNNGFVIKWTDDGMGEHYQVSDLQVKSVAKNPNSAIIAIYETDGYLINRVTVIDWRSFARKYTINFDQTVTSLAFSAAGTYLLVGTAEVGGTYIYAANTGKLSAHLSSVPGMITYIQTGASEKTAVMYSSTGSIIYYDIANSRIKTRMNTEKLLSQTMLFGTGDKANCYLAGVKNNTIYIINATNGKVIGQYAATNPFIVSSKSSTEEGLFFVSTSGKNQVLQLIDNETLATLFNSNSTNTYNPTTPTQIKKLSSLSSQENFTCSLKVRDQVYLGTNLGNLYRTSSAFEAQISTFIPVTENMYEKIYDIDCDSSYYYMLTPATIYKTSYDNRTVETVCQNTGYTNIIKSGDTIYLWSMDSKKSVQYVDLTAATPQPKNLFTPTSEIQNLRISGDKIIFVQGNTSVSMYDMTSKRVSDIYTGTAINDAILVNNTDLYVAKAKSGENDSALISVNLSTKETLPLNIGNANMAYALCSNTVSNKTKLYGVKVSSTGSQVSSDIFVYTIEDGTVSSLHSIAEEDTTAFTCITDRALYTNLGKNQLRSCSTVNTRKLVYRRSASIPKKLTYSSSKIAVLNKDGSISWYNLTSQAVLADWYLTVDGSWYEF